MATLRLVRTRTVSTESEPKPQRGHVLPRAPLVDLSGPGRLRTAHVLALCGISHSTLYVRLHTGTFPAPDGKDGGLNFWNTLTIKNFLEGESPIPQGIRIGG